MQRGQVRKTDPHYANPNHKLRGVNGGTSRSLVPPVLFAFSLHLLVTLLLPLHHPCSLPFLFLSFLFRQADLCLFLSSISVLLHPFSSIPPLPISQRSQGSCSNSALILQPSSLPSLIPLYTLAACTDIQRRSSSTGLPHTQIHSSPVVPCPLSSLLAIFSSFPPSQSLSPLISFFLSWHYKPTAGQRASSERLFQRSKLTSSARN